ncbi:hypothetical protein M407DRAFT_17261 [Tulasnella calospora MUT 4182]|uniref:Uncharacterized protein n=1 Tax=Tulasnella calospora MUT 4182 TaxID=1051891 RepID=A0A0C3QXY3_9AGAM|nr:hypothetical protein M407DRAFT_17261 [Tulasnella calospora MUT 4182]
MAKAIWKTSPDPRSADETDLLIRSLTTLLHLLPEPPVLVDPKSEQHRSHRRKRGRTSYRGILLDRAALLLVSGHEPSDAAAVNAIIHPYAGIHVVVVKERPRGLDPIVVSEDGKKLTVLDPRFVNTPSSADLALELGNDDIASRPFPRSSSGQDVIPPDVHAEHLVELFREGFHCKNDFREDNRRRLKRYVLLYSFSKIRERFDAEWTPGENAKFRDFFIVANSPHATFSSEEYQNVSPPESDEGLPEFPRMPDDESWLLRWLRSYGYALDTDPNDATKIRWTVESGMYVYRCISANINAVRLCLSQIEKTLECPKDPNQDEKKRYKQATGALDKLADALDMIYLAVYQSPTFWKTMHTLQPLIQHHLSQPRTSPSKHALGQRDLPSTADHAADLIEDDCAYELDDLADDPDIQLLGPEVRKLRHWLILLSQWTNGISKLGSLLYKFSRSPPHSVTVWTKYADPPVLRREQASLFETLVYVETDLSMNDRIQVVKDATSRSKVKSRALNILRSVKANEDPLEWLGVFEGSIHCEAQLSEGWQRTEFPCHSIGSSRRSCFCCDLLLECQHLRTGMSSLGEVVPWAPPLGLDPLIKEKILRQLVARLQRFFVPEPPSSQLIPPLRDSQDQSVFKRFTRSTKRKR